MDDADYMGKAIEKAKKGVKDGQSPFGACIVKKGRILAVEHNRVFELGDPTAHAEIVAIKAAAKKLKSIDLSGCTVYSTCEPCPMCFSACHWARISKIVYGTRIEDARKIGFHEFPIHDTTLKDIGKSNIKITGDYMRDESMELFGMWSKRKNKKKY
jgi:tRNA(Arg) A34 adenosine deaminase TadA